METGGCGEAAGGIEREEGDGVVVEASDVADNHVLAWVAIMDYGAVDGAGRGCDAQAEVGVLWGGRGG